MKTALPRFDKYGVEYTQQDVDAPRPKDDEPEEVQNEERELLTREQATALLPEGEEIHTFRSSPGILFGADWPREKILKAIATHECCLAGPQSEAMGHGLAIFVDGWLFVEVKKQLKKDGAK